MSVGGFDHINIRTDDVAGTIAFYRDALLMQGSVRTDRSGQPLSGRVLDDRGNEILHVGSIGGAYPGDGDRPGGVTRGGGAIDHIAFDCTGYGDMRQRLLALGLSLIENAIPAERLRQIFVRDPNGVKIELNFRDGAGPAIL